MLDPQQIKQSYLRMIVYVLPASWVYDLVWVLYKSKEYWNDREEGGMTQLLLIMVYLMLFYKIALFVIMWKASMNFPKFVR